MSPAQRPKLTLCAPIERTDIDAAFQRWLMEVAETVKELNLITKRRKGKRK